ncbi:MAG: SDR family oxidoreductase [Lachnospiraceae bacterium]
MSLRPICWTLCRRRYSPQLAQETPLGRLGTPEDIAAAVSFLADEKASFITGQVLTCDGGFIL